MSKFKLRARSWVFCAQLLCGLSFWASVEASSTECGIWIDEMKIPHVRASREEDALTCLGYVHGRLRAWQMDYLRKVSQGRAAEILGKEKVRSDFFLRLLDFSGHSRRIHSEMDPRLQVELASYARGVNQGMRAALSAGVYEFQDLGYQPEEWKPADTVSLLLLMALDQTKKTFEERIREESRAAKWGNRTRDLFTEDGLPWDTAILKAGEYATREKEVPVGPLGEAVSAAALKEWLDDLPELFPALETGSNNWVVSAAKSRSGKALLANDPHLELKTPAFWQWVHLHAGELDVIGAGVPGIPIFGSGASRTVSWGLTNAYLDASDLFYLPESDLVEPKRERPWVWVRFGGIQLPIFFRSISRTREGWPMLPIEAPQGKVAVLRWSGLAIQGKDLSGLIDVMRSKSVTEMDQALSRAALPGFNYVFADISGKIGYRAIGTVPRRTKEPPFGIVDLKAGEGIPPWVMRTPEEMPHLMNPARGFIVTANNRQWPKDGMEHGGRAYARGLRAFRIEELIAAKPRHDAESMKKIQCDVQAVDARFVLPELVKRVSAARPAPASEHLSRALRLLSAWNYETDVGCQACSIYRMWLVRLGERFEGLDAGVLYRLLKNESEGGGVKQALFPALPEALQEALERVGVTTEAWALRSWGGLHVAPFPHLAGPERYPAPAVSTPGDEFSVNLGQSKWDGKILEHKVGASLRLVVEMTNPPQVQLSLAGSNADDPDRNTADPQGAWRKWARCETDRARYPLDWSTVRTETVRID